MVKHVVKGEKWACSTLEAGKNKPIDYIAKTRDFKRFSEKIKKIGGSVEPPILVGLFIPDLLKGKKPRWSKHIPKGPKMLVFTRNLETWKEYDYGKVHH